MRIAKEGIAKIACTTCYGSSKFLEMPFSLTNTLVTSCTLVNNVLQPFLDKFVVVYLDDIIIYSCMLEEHVHHLTLVLKVLQANELYVKKENYAFSQLEYSY